MNYKKTITMNIIIVFALYGVYNATVSLSQVVNAQLEKNVYSDCVEDNDLNWCKDLIITNKSKREENNNEQLSLQKENEQARKVMWEQLSGTSFQ